MKRVRKGQKKGEEGAGAVGKRAEGRRGAPDTHTVPLEKRVRFETDEGRDEAAQRRAGKEPAALNMVDWDRKQ